MSKVKKPIVLDETAQEIRDALRTQNVILNIMAESGIAVVNTLDELHRVVQSGNAAKVFNIGDQIIVPWTDKATGSVYQAVHDVVHFGNVTLEDGESVPAMFLQWHYATPFSVQFDAREAVLSAVDAAISAGTYHFTVSGSAWGQVTAGTYQFTLTQAIPKGGVAVFSNDIYSSGIAGGTVATYADRATTEIIESCAVTAGSAGTDLGAFSAAGTTTVNSYQKCAYGYNRWAHSGIRQWLNSKAANNAWWSPKNNFDRPPTELATKHGFMSGYEDDFLAIVQPIKLSTALNTVSDAGIEEDNLEDTFDTFFLPALVNEHITPQLAGEGEDWEYWKRVSKSANTLATGGTYPQMRTYAVENHSSAQTVRLRSALRGFAYGTWLVYSSGNVNGGGHGHATYSNRCAPVCAVC